MNKKWSLNQLNTNKAVIRMNRFRKLRFGSFAINSFVVMIFIFVGLFYIVSVNITSTKGGQLHTLQLEKKKIVAQNERLALEAARLASLAVIEGGAQEKIEIGDDGRPTGRIIVEADKDEVEIREEDPEKITYVSKLVPIGGMSYLEWSSSLAHK